MAFLLLRDCSYIWLGRKLVAHDCLGVKFVSLIGSCH